MQVRFLWTLFLLFIYLFIFFNSLIPHLGILWFLWLEWFNKEWMIKTYLSHKVKLYGFQFRICFSSKFIKLLSDICSKKLMQTCFLFIFSLSLVFTFYFFKSFTGRFMIKLFMDVIIFVFINLEKLNKLGWDHF